MIGRMIGVALASLFAIIIVGFALAVRDQPLEPVPYDECMRKAMRPYAKAKCAESLKQ